MRSQQNWMVKHLNWTYGVALLIGIAILIYVGFIQNNAIGLLAYFIVAIGGGFLVLWAKKRLNVSWIYILLIFSIGLGFPIAVLCLRNHTIKTELRQGEKISVFTVPRDELIGTGYKYYCLGCGAVHKELSFQSVQGRLDAKMCSCGTNSFATLDGDKPVP